MDVVGFVDKMVGLRGLAVIGAMPLLTYVSVCVCVGGGGCYCSVFVRDGCPGNA